jgi:hypothetical protein
VSVQTLTTDQAPTFRLTILEPGDDEEAANIASKCGYSWHERPGSWVDNARERARKAAERELRRKPTTKTARRPALPSNFAVGVTLPHVAGRHHRPLDAKQRAAYEAAMGQKWEREYSEQFEYTGMPRYSYTDAWTKVKHTREDQVAALTGFTP